jgi:hypothetical protein
VLAAVARRPVDRPPVSFWRHVPDVDHTSKGLADAMLAFHRRWDLDLIKVMSLAAGLGEGKTLLQGPAAAVAAEARDAVAQTRGLGLIVTPGCVLPLAVPDAHLAAAVEAVRAP